MCVTAQTSLNLELILIGWLISTIPGDNAMHTQTVFSTQSQAFVQRVGNADSRFKQRYPAPLAVLGFAAFLLVSAPAIAQSYLGTAANFAVLGASAVTCTVASAVTGNLGISPNGLGSITGYPVPPCTVTGVIQAANGVSLQAQTDLTTAYNTLASQSCTVDLSGQDLGGLTLTPGVYCFSSSAQLTGPLTLNALGNPNAVFIFKIGSTLTTASASSVNMINSGSSCGVSWQVGSSATLGTTTNLAGNILALASITLNTNASVSGRTLARTGAVTAAGNIDSSTCAAFTGPGLPPGPGVPTLAIPTLSQWVMVVLAGLLAIAGFAAMRRRAS